MRVFFMKQLTKSKKFLLDIPIIFLGTLIVSLGINLFLSHAQLLSVTSLRSTGEFTHENRKMLYCVVTARQMIALKNEILKKDPHAFFNILDISEVKGGGFKNI